jgi:hypothetical protein
VAAEQRAPLADTGIQVHDEHDERLAAVADAVIQVHDEHRAPITHVGREGGKVGMEDQRLALAAECHTLEQRWDTLHDEVLRLDQEWRRLMDGFSSMEARRNGGPPDWTNGVATYFELRTHAAQTSTLATEALQTCERFARALQRTLAGSQR